MALPVFCSLVDCEAKATDWKVVFPSNWDGNSQTWTFDDQWGNYSRRPIARHTDGLNMGFVDGHVKFLRGDAAFGPYPNGYAFGDPRNGWDSR